MPTNQDAFVSSSVTTKNETDQEEVWVNAEGVNVFDESLLLKLKVQSLRLKEHAIWYKSYSEIEMTPLDMYNPLDAHQDHLSQQHCYDGTGTLAWLASKALAWAFDQDVHGIFSKYIMSQENQKRREKTLILELGCGTGLSGLATLLLTTPDAASKPNVKVVFTDSDMESLDNCRDNCELNGIPSDRYAHERLSWGMPDTYPSNCLGAVDVVLAADVLYDVKMIAPLLQTAYTLLRPHSLSGNLAIDQSDGPNFASEGGYLILSHVPRFCLSREDHEHDDHNDPSDTDHSSTRTKQPFQLLEEHIIHLALSCGFVLITMFRPHMVLLQYSTTGNDEDDQQFRNDYSKDASISSETCQTMSVHKDVLNQEQLVQLETANACVFVFQKK